MFANLAKHTVFHNSFSWTLLSCYEVLLGNNSYASGLSFHVFSRKCLADTSTTNALKIFVVSGGGIRSKSRECQKEFPPNTVTLVESRFANPNGADFRDATVLVRSLNDRSSFI